MRRFGFALSGLMVATVLAVGAPAAASTITYQLAVDHCTGGCGSAVATVFLDDHNTTGNVAVRVTLLSPCVLLPPSQPFKP